MARVKISKSTDQLMQIREYARRCFGEFFGNDGDGLVFGFTCNGHARLFAKKVSNHGVNAVLFAVS